MVMLLCAQVHVDRSKAKVPCDAGSIPAPPLYKT